MNEYYDKLMELQGADELKEVIRKWDTLSSNISKRTFDSQIILPDLFVYTRSGFGNTRMLSLLSEYLDSKGNLMDFYGDAKFFEFKMDYCPPDQPFRELYRLIDTVDVAAGFRNEFKGLVRININDWIGHHDERYFREFLCFLQSNTSCWLIVLTISNTEENEETKAMESVVSMYLRLETVTLNLPTNDEMVEHCAQNISKFGLELDDSAKKVLLESIAVLRENEYFYGLHTIKDLCSDIVYSLFSNSSDVSKVIDASMISEFSCDSEYIKRTIRKIKKVTTVGF